MNHPLQCLCGTIRGYVVRPGLATRAVCYSKDCQAFACFLNQGLKALTCMSLSEKGMLRWYGCCCNTPIGSTPRDFRTPYLGLVENRLQSESLSIEASFGPVALPHVPTAAERAQFAL